MTTEKQTKLPVKPLINPLTDEDRVALEQILHSVPHIEDLLCRAEACGLDVQQHRDRHEAHKEVATKLHTHFFPQQLPSPTEL